MALSLRNLLAGLIAGVALSLGRAPAGLELTDGPWIDASSAAFFRALALFTVAIGVGPRVRVPALLTGAAAGYGLHGLFLAERAAVTGWGTLALALALSVVGMGWASPREEPRAGDAGEREESPGPNPLERLGLALAGAGAAIALESVARVLRLFGGGRPMDDTAFGLAFLGAVALGAVAFGGLASSGRRAPAGIPGGLALAAAACLLSVRLMSEISSYEQLDAFLRSRPWSLDLSRVGKLSGDLLIGGRVLLVPAFLLGAGLAGARDRARLVSLGIGGAAGLLLLPLALIDGTPVPAEEAGRLAAERVASGALVAAAGGLMALAGAWKRASRPAWSGGALACGIALAVAALGPRPFVLPLSPWERFRPSAEWLADTPEGLMTLESHRGGASVVTLDRRPLTPGGAGERADEQRLRLSFELLAPQRRSGARVLLVGQLTPLRAFALRGLGAGRIDRTAVWHASMAELEALLFGAGTPPEGDVLSPAEADDRARSGRYDLIVVPPVPGAAPRLEIESGSARAVVWLGATSDIAGGAWGGFVLLASDGFEQLSVGVHGGGEGVHAGRPVPSPSAFHRLRLRTFERESESERAVARRLSAAAAGTATESLCAGLLEHLRVQVQSSPWETEAQATEISSGALAHLREAVGALTDPATRTFVRELWEGIADVLVQKREIDLIYEHLEPLAQAQSPWPALEEALAHADLEVLDPESAARRLEKVLAASSFDLDARLMRARALGMAGDPAGEAQELRRVLAVQPGRRDVRRRLAVALVRAGDPEGAERVADLLREDPDDEELRVYLGPGPFAPLPVEFTPHGGDADDH